MGISLSKGGNVSLSKEEPGLDELIIGLGWEPRATDGKEFDLDATLFMLAANGKVRAAGSGLTDDVSDFCFYKNMSLADGAVVHQGDNRNGEGEGDDEQIKVILSKIPADVQKLAVVITIFEARQRGQNFGMVGNSFARIVNAKTDREITRFDLSEDAATETAMIIGELYRNGAEWKFKAVAQGYQGGLYKVCQQFGIDANDDG